MQYVINNSAEALEFYAGQSLGKYNGELFISHYHSTFLPMEIYLRILIKEVLMYRS